MANSNPIFIPLSKLNNGNNCVTHQFENFSGNIHYTPDGVLICSAEYNSLEEDLEQVFDSIGLDRSYLGAIFGSKANRIFSLDGCG